MGVGEGSSVGVMLGRGIDVFEIWEGVAVYEGDAGAEEQALTRVQSYKYSKYRQEILIFHGCLLLELYVVYCT